MFTDHYRRTPLFRQPANFPVWWFHLFLGLALLHVFWVKKMFFTEQDGFCHEILSSSGSPLDLDNVNLTIPD
jgi:hypothetical protein